MIPLYTTIQAGSVRIGRVILRVLLAVTVIGCDGFVETELPNSQLSTTTVFADKATANAAMTDIYTKLRDTGLFSGLPQGAGCLLGHYADELVFYGNGTSPVPPFFNDGIPATNPTAGELWNASYYQIYACNSVIAGVSASTALEPADRDQLIGEALVTRALVHFYLAGIYGDVPYVTTTDYRQNSIAQRMPVHEIYSRIIADLEQAAVLLPETYLSAERARPNRLVAMALMARVYLYAGQWEEASNSASAVLNHTELYEMEADLNMVFLKGSRSTIWQLVPGIDGKNTDEALIYLFTTVPPPLTALSDGLVAAFEFGDGRRTAWIGSVTDGSAIYYHANKYKAGGSVTTQVECPILFRVEEQLLIRAEARAISGDLIGSKEDLNRVRHRAGLGDTPAVSGSELADAVLSERRVELFTEYGHRFLDLKRTGHLDAVLTGVKPGWNSTDAFWPLPQAELVTNPRLQPQNPGY